ncbi:hypothetical protein [Massilia polaris]|uniref:hypothetical protein n=1 Tax=Massilia polaris TaxID=2728846 RepID=UPI00146C7F99|nr:hypothetical protein [Massilia polaris]
MEEETYSQPRLSPDGQHIAINVRIMRNGPQNSDDDCIQAAFARTGQSGCASGFRNSAGLFMADEQATGVAERP